MVIESLNVSNFRSIDKASLSFTPFTIIVGANAAGKSNLISIFRFIQDIINLGIEDAIELQGGTSFLANVRFSKGSPICIDFTISMSKRERWARGFSTSKLGMVIEKIECGFSIVPNKRGNGFYIGNDSISLYYVAQSIDENKRVSSFEGKKFCVEYAKKSEKSSYQMNISGELTQDIKKELVDDIASKVFLQFANKAKKELLLNRIEFLLPPVVSINKFIRVFDFDPKELKRSSPIAATKVLSENGSNIALVLHEILRKKDTKERFEALIKQYMPQIKKITVESNYDKSLSYKVNEKYSNKSFHPLFLSDGTVSIIAIIIALYFDEKSSIIILEEPERNIHPKLLPIIIKSAEEVSSKKQVLITTHNPELLKHSSIDDIRFVYRNNNGNTDVSKPADDAVVKSFIKCDLGIDDLFVNDLLRNEK